MALVSLLFRTLGVRNMIGLLRLDATLREMHDRSSNITDHAIEGGSFVQDHIQRNPRRLTMEAMVTDTPLTGFSVGTQGAYEILDLTWKLGIPFFVVSGLHVYPQMAFETLSMPKQREGALRFTCTMKELTFTESAVVQVAGEPAPDPALKKGNVSNAPAQAAGTNAGRQATTPVPDAATGGGSLLSQLVGPR